MRFKALNGKERYKNVESKRVNWNKASLSYFQKSVKDFLRPYWQHHAVYEELPVMGTRLRIDLYNANRRIAIECNGQQHYKFNKFFHKNNRDKYLNQIIRDDVKLRWCELNHIVLVEIVEADLPLNVEFFKRFDITL